jgi:hypothetical protein
MSVFTTDSFHLAKFTNCIRLTDGLYTGTPAAYPMIYSSATDSKITFVIVVTTAGHQPDRVGAIFLSRTPAWIDRFGLTKIRGIGPLVARGDVTATASEKASLARHVRGGERRCVAAATH